LNELLLGTADALKLDRNIKGVLKASKKSTKFQPSFNFPFLFRSSTKALLARLKLISIEQIATFIQNVDGNQPRKTCKHKKVA
jgi:hypothetical protein